MVVVHALTGDRPSGISALAASERQRCGNLELKPRLKDDPELRPSSKANAKGRPLNNPPSYPQAQAVLFFSLNTAWRTCNP